jgi:phenylalanyl-tRNA synthetase beta chain
MNGHEIMAFYSKDKKMKEYADIIKDSDIFPLITDSNQTILSLPPLINGDHSKIKLSTKNVFIEMTACDLTKAKIALNTFVSMFSQVKYFYYFYLKYCSTPFEVE